MAQTKLKPCPFCGHAVKGSRFTHTWMSMKHKTYSYKVSCKNPDCTIHPSTPTFDDNQESTETWNRRAE